MSYNVEQLLILATEFDKLATESLEKAAAKKNPKSKIPNKDKKNSKTETSKSSKKSEKD